MSMADTEIQELKEIARKLHDAVQENTHVTRTLGDQVKGLHITMFGPDGTNGVAEYAKRAHSLAEEHEQILRGRDRRSGMISEMNVWKKVSGGGVLAGLAALGELIRRWFASN